jgi:hypothetical protein
MQKRTGEKMKSTKNLDILANEIFDKISKLHGLEQTYIMIKLNTKINGDDQESDEMLAILKKELVKLRGF